MSLDTKEAKVKKHSNKKAKAVLEKKIEKAANEGVERLLSKVEKEERFPEGIIYPVKNTIIVDELRRQVELKEQQLRELEERHKEEEQKRKEEEQKRKEEEQKNVQMKLKFQNLISLLKKKGVPDEEIKRYLE